MRKNKGRLRREILSSHCFKVSNRRPLKNNGKTFDRTRTYIAEDVGTAELELSYARGVIAGVGNTGCYSRMWYDNEDRCWRVAVHFHIRFEYEDEDEYDD